MKNKKLLVPLALALGLGALITRKGSSDKRALSPFVVEKKKHSSLKIPKSLLQAYLAEGGVRIVLEFIKRGSYIKLRFNGFTSDDSLCIQQDLDTVKANALNSGNIYYGSITKDDAGVNLHDLIANVTQDKLNDWYLTPVKYKNSDERYVAYDLSDTSSPLTLRRLNPSPPAT